MALDREKTVEPQLLTYQQAADFVGISQGTIKKMVARKELVKLNICGCIRFRKSDLEKLIDQSWQAATDF
jgi:excisionase family DNA binding protein